MVIEMRTYRLKPGCRERFLDVFRAQSMPAHAEIGMKILGPFRSIENEDTFFFMRGFPDLESRAPMKAKFYEGELWNKEFGECIDADDRELRGRVGRRPGRAHRLEIGLGFLV